MSVDLSDFVEQIKAQVNPPGTDLYPTSTDDDWVLRLIGGFWNARLEGVTALDAYTADEDGVVTPQGSGADMTRELVQLVIVWAAFQVIVTTMNNLKTQVRAQAGSASFEQQQSATLLRDSLAAVKSQKDLIIERLSDVGVVLPRVANIISTRDTAMMAGALDWVAAGFDSHSRGSGVGRGFGP